MRLSLRVDDTIRLARLWRKDPRGSKSVEFNQAHDLHVGNEASRPSRPCRAWDIQRSRMVPLLSKTTFVQCAPSV